MKKILLSIAMLSTAYAATSQVLFSDNFNALTVGAIATDPTGAAAGQNGWTLYDDCATFTAANYSVVNIGGSDNVLRMTGSALAGASTSPSEYEDVFQMFDISTATAGNDILTLSFKLYTGAQTTTSKNSFDVAILDGSFNSLVGIEYVAETGKLLGYLWATSGGTQSTYAVQLGTGGAADLILTPNSTIDLTLTVNTVSGQVSWSGVGAAAATFAFSATGDAAGLVPTEFDVMANAGTANAASSSADFDNFVLTAVVDPAASIKTIVAKEFSVSPNPASDVVNVSLKNNGEVITLTSAEGRVIETRVSNNATESFDVKGLNAGVYFFTVGTTTEKVIIK